MSKTKKMNAFQVRLLDAMGAMLPGEWETKKPPDCKIIRRYPWGYAGVGLMMNSKWYPKSYIKLIYGLKYDALEPTFRKLDEARGLPYFDSFYVHRLAADRCLVEGRGNLSSVDCENADIEKLSDELLGGGSVERLMEIIERFSDLRELRRTLEEEGRRGALDSYKGGAIMIAIDIALDDLDHLRAYRETHTRPLNFVVDDQDLEMLGIEL